MSWLGTVPRPYEITPEADPDRNSKFDANWSDAWDPRDGKVLVAADCDKHYVAIDVQELREMTTIPCSDCKPTSDHAAYMRSWRQRQKEQRGL